MGAPKFTPFPVPVAVTDLPLVTHAGHSYRCSGCGTLVPEGVWITETIKDGMIVGLSMRIGADGAFIHQCGDVGPTVRS
jgi:hypothetical protein